MKNPSRLSRVPLLGLLAVLALSGAVGCGSSDAIGGSPGSSGIPLSISVTGVGSGKVASDVGNISCTKTGDACNASLAAGTAVTLTATPDKGSFFNGWSGGSCQGTGPCTLTLNQAASVQASFVIKVLFYSNRSLDPTQDAPGTPGAINIWMANSDGSNPQALAGIVAADSFQPSLSPDGNQIAFLSDRKLDDPSAINLNNARNVWLMDADGGHLHPLAGLDLSTVDVNSSSNPQWAPDGNRIAFASDRDINGGQVTGSKSNNIWVVDANDTNLKVLAGIDINAVDSSNPVWSPDGTKIAFQSNRDIDLNPAPNPSLQDNIWVIDADGNTPTPLTKLTAAGVFAQRPQWSPDSSQIVFQSNRSLGNNPNSPKLTATNIWKMNADGSHPVHLTADIVSIFNEGPQWSPDGSLIVYDSNKDPNNPGTNGAGIDASNIWAVAADGSQNPFPLTSLTDSQIGCVVPYWAPNGNAVIFACNRNLDPSIDTPPNAADNIWIVNPDGSGAFPVTKLTNPDTFTSSAIADVD